MPSAERQIETLYLEHSEAILAFFRRSLALAKRDAQDLLQQTYLEALKSFSKNPSLQLESPRAFLFKIAQRCLYAHIRKRDRAPSREVEVEEIERASDRDDAEYLATMDSHYRLLLRAMRRLHDLERTPSVGERGEHRVSKLQLILYLRRWEGLTIPQVAEVLGIPEGTVASSQRRALEQMEKIVGTLDAPRDVSKTSTAVLRSWWGLLEDEAKKIVVDPEDRD